MKPLLSDIYLWLAYSRVSTHKINKLLDNISPSELWETLGCDTARYSLDDRTFSALKRSHSVDYIDSVKNYLKVNNIEYVTRADPLFPEGLAQREVDPPLALFYKGNLDIARLPCIAVVGTRRSSGYGKYATERIAGELAKGFTIVSGLATGIDGYAHASALNVGGNTIAVLGSGLFNASPSSNLGLLDDIIKRGLVISEYTPDTHASAYTFPQRNRIISGLCKGVLVVEAAEKSGSLITADCALEQGRDVFAVPGDIDKIRSVGTNKLIKHGAIAVTSADDIYDFYGMAHGGVKIGGGVAELDFSETRVMQALADGDKSFDALVENCGMSVSELNTALSSLLIEGLIRQKSKNVYCVTQKA